MPIVAAIDSSQANTVAGFPVTTASTPVNDGAFAATFKAAEVAQAAPVPSALSQSTFAKNTSSTQPLPAAGSVKTLVFAPASSETETADAKVAEEGTSLAGTGKPAIVPTPTHSQPEEVTEGSARLGVVNETPAPSKEEAAPGDSSALATEQTVTTEGNPHEHASLGVHFKQQTSRDAGDQAVASVPTPARSVPAPSQPSPTKPETQPSGAAKAVAPEQADHTVDPGVPEDQPFEARTLAPDVHSDSTQQTSTANTVIATTQGQHGDSIKEFTPVEASAPLALSRNVNERKDAPEAERSVTAPAAANVKAPIVAVTVAHSPAETGVKSAEPKKAANSARTDAAAKKPVVTVDSVVTDLPVIATPAPRNVPELTAEFQTKAVKQEKVIAAPISEPALVVSNGVDIPVAKAATTDAAPGRQIRETSPNKPKHPAAFLDLIRTGSAASPQQEVAVPLNSTELPVAAPVTLSAPTVPVATAVFKTTEKTRAIVTGSVQKPQVADAKVTVATVEDAKLPTSDASQDVGTKGDVAQKTTSTLSAAPMMVSKSANEQVTPQTVSVATPSPTPALHISGALSATQHETGAKPTSATSTDDWSVQSYEAPSSNRLEIGVSGGSWGWLKVRAELGQSGGVHAYLRGASASAEGELRSQAGELQTYLQGQQVSVQGVHVETSRHAGGYGETSGFSGQGGQRRDENDGRPSGNAAFRGQKNELQNEIGNAFITPARLNGGGGWLNVLA